MDPPIRSKVFERAQRAHVGVPWRGAWRDALRSRGLDYVVGVSTGMKVWREGEGPDPIGESPGRGRPKTRRYPGQFTPVEISALAAERAVCSFGAPLGPCIATSWIPAAKWAKVLDDPARDESQRPKAEGEPGPAVALLDPIGEAEEVWPRWDMRLALRILAAGVASRA